MDKKLLLDIIDNGIDEIKLLCSDFISNNPSRKDIDIAIKKTELLLKEFSLLLECKNEVLLDTKTELSIPIIESINNTPIEAVKTTTIEPIKNIPIDTIKISSEIKSTNNCEDIRSFIGINDKFLFIRELFNGDSNLYNEFIDKINTTKDIKEALEINSQFNMNKEEESTKLFTEILNRKFL